MDKLTQDQQIRAIAARIAAEVTGEGQVTPALVRKAADIEKYIRTGNTR